MKRVLLPLLAIMFFAAPAMAIDSQLPGAAGVNTLQYHSYDGLVCGDCHTLHNSEDGAAVALDGGPNKELLKRGNWTDMCLSCHMQGQNTSATAALPDVADTGWIAPIVMTLDGVDPAGVAMPGGDFYYSNINEKMGHNPAYSAGEVGGTASSVMMAADSVLGDVPPGGIIDGDDEWGCHSCHGMHSRFSSSYTAWRQVQRKVNGKVVSGDVTGFGVETAAGNKGMTEASFEPIKSNSRGDVQGTLYVDTRADGNPVEGASLFADESDTNKNVYRGGFSSFCAACHGDFHGGNGEAENVANANTNPDADGRWMRHPTNIVMADKNTTGLGSRKYGTNSYTAQVTNSQGTSPNPEGYDWRYPLIQADGDFTVTVAGTGVTVPDASLDTSRLSCLTCHKAHATQYENMTRWDATGHAFIADGALDMNGIASNGDNPAFGCGKCHQKGGTNAFVKSF